MFLLEQPNIGFYKKFIPTTLSKRDRSTSDDLGRLVLDSAPSRKLCILLICRKVTYGKCFYFQYLLYSLKDKKGVKF